MNDDDLKPVSEGEPLYQFIARRRRRITVAIFLFSMTASLVCSALDVSVRIGGGFFFAAGVSIATLLWLSQT